MSASPYTTCPHFAGQAGHAVRCGAGHWGGFPSQGVCDACFAGAISPAAAGPPPDPALWRSMDEVAVNEAICRACQFFVTDQKCIKLLFSNEKCSFCSAPWVRRERAQDCPAQKWPAPPPTVYPGISCYMPTRALPPGMHGEAVACFLSQDYPGPRELVIYNNDPLLTLVFDHPDVTIVNEPRNGRTLGQLFNATISECRYDLLACWEDDDIRLATHLSSMFRNLGDAGAVRSRRYWYLEQNVIREWSGNGPAHSGWLLRRAALAAAGGYPADSSVNCDHLVWAALEKSGRALTWDCQPAETTLLYRWDSGSIHLSGFGVEGPVMDHAADATEFLRDTGQVVTGLVEIYPALLADYQAIVAAYIKENRL